MLTSPGQATGKSPEPAGWKALRYDVAWTFLSAGSRDFSVPRLRRRSHHFLSPLSPLARFDAFFPARFLADVLPSNPVSKVSPAIKQIVLCLVLVLLFASTLVGGTLTGHVRDQNWYAQYQSNAFGVGYYEFAVNANATNNSSLGGFAATDVFGVFSMPNLPGGSYTVASWDVWWRSAYAFNVAVPAGGTSLDVDLRLKSTMWGYPAFWDSTGFYEFGQTFVATGPVTMIYLRDPLNTAFTRTVTMHAGGPGGAQVGATRTYGNGGDQRFVYSFGEMLTVARQTYYLRIRSPSPTTGAVLMQMDPRPDFSDPMPGGCLYVGNGTTLTALRDRDLGVVIMSDDDGLVTDLFARASGTSLSGVTSVGQTFIARGVHLISAAFWLAEPSAPTYVVRLLEDGPGGAQIGTAKRGKPARLTADPEMIVAWAPGECPLTAGQTYYLEVTRDGGGTFNAVYVNRSNPYAFGQAYQDGAALAGVDLAGTIMEEENEGSAADSSVRITSDPYVPQADRTTNQFRITWTTDVPSDSAVAYAAEHPPYVAGESDVETLGLNHSMTLTGLQPHTMYHFRVKSAAPNRRPAVSRDFVICTRPAASNLLVNPGFEDGTGPSPRSTIPGWTKTAGVDIRTSDGSWFWSLKPTNGTWLLQGTVNGSSSDASIYQRVSGVTPGSEYTFSAWVMTAMRENSAWKYDVWNSQSRLIYMRLGIDPTGGTNAANATVQWTPRLYSHRHYTQLATTAVAQSSNLTVFISMKGDGGEWHNYCVDDCALTHEDLPLRFDAPAVLPDGALQLTLLGKANRSNFIEGSSAFANWNTVTGVWNSTGRITTTNRLPSGTTNRFFRARQEISR